MINLKFFVNYKSVNDLTVEKFLESKRANVSTICANILVPTLIAESPDAHTDADVDTETKCL